MATSGVAVEEGRGSIRGLTLILPLSLYRQMKPAQDSANHTITVDNNKVQDLMMEQFWIENIFYAQLFSFTV